jgi:hypothetical protein
MLRYICDARHRPLWTAEPVPRIRFQRFPRWFPADGQAEVRRLAANNLDVPSILRPDEGAWLANWGTWAHPFGLLADRDTEARDVLVALPDQLLQTDLGEIHAFTARFGLALVLDAVATRARPVALQLLWYPATWDGWPDSVRPHWLSTEEPPPCPFPRSACPQWRDSERPDNCCPVCTASTSSAVAPPCEDCAQRFRAWAAD